MAGKIGIKAVEIKELRFKKSWRREAVNDI
jgi:hypothetical protein